MTNDRDALEELTDTLQNVMPTYLAASGGTRVAAARNMARSILESKYRRDEVLRALGLNEDTRGPEHPYPYVWPQECSRWLSDWEDA